METVFITIHDLSLDARIKYCSESIEDILGYRPHEVRGKSCWEYFHPDEIPFARAIHGRGLDLEKAASLNYARIKHKNGSWVGCECVFTVVHDVLVASTAIYQRGDKAIQRAVDGENVRRIFSSSPRDPRYHMLSYISNKFTERLEHNTREVRAALILNRFSRSSSIMFATNGVEQILGLSPTQLVGKSFYYCIDQGCLTDAIKTVESAKANDSIAYLRFLFRNPTQEEGPIMPELESDEDDDGGVALSPGQSSHHSSVDMMSPASDGVRISREPSQDDRIVDGIQAAPFSNQAPTGNGHASQTEIDRHQSRVSSENSTDTDGNGRDNIFDTPMHPAQSSTSSLVPEVPQRHIEIEAVISCTSDGLVVVLRRAHTAPPRSATTSQSSYPNGLFASPWATNPVMPPGLRQTSADPFSRPPAAAEPVEPGFMSAIRDVAVFAWSLTGINGTLYDYASGTPSDEAFPPGGLPVWDPNAPPGQNDNYNGFAGSTHRRIPGMGEPVLPKAEEDITSSDDEIVWKRVPQMPPFKRHNRRAHEDAFGTDSTDSSDGSHQNVEQGASQRQRRKLEHDSSREGSL